MRLVNFHADDGVRIGVVNGDDVIDLTSVDAAAPRDIQAVIADDAFQAVQSIADKATDADMRKFDSLSFAPPVSSPGKILCLGLNYMEHVNEGIFEKQPFPTVFMRTATSMIAHNEPLIRPSVSETLDFEAELALIVGKRSRHLTEENALDAVAGYSCANDGSVREFQRHTIQWTMGKNFDNTGPFGPVFVTADELPAGAKGINIECRLNG